MQKTQGGDIYLNIGACNLPLSAAFNGGPGKNVSAGQTYKENPFNYFSLTNNNAVAVTVTFSSGQHPASSQPADNSVSNASHTALGNLTVATGGPAAGGLPACDANGYLQITTAMNLLVPGTNNGHRRQLITFDVSPNSPKSLLVQDANGCVLQNIPAGQARQMVTDAPLYLSGNGATAWAVIGQIFLNS